MVVIVVGRRGSTVVTVALGRRVAVIVVAVGALPALGFFTTGD